jgi:hypothetical protein
MTKIHIEVDTREVDKELDRLIKGPTAGVIGEFEALLIEVTGQVAEDIHIETGSLFSTVHPTSEMLPFHWQGTIHVGGAAPGQINDPAYYGVFELARGHDGGRNHHFYEVAHEQMPHDMIVTILEYLDSGDWHR